MTKNVFDDIERDLRELFDRQHHAVIPENRVWDENEPLVVVDLATPRIGRRRRVAVTAAALVASAAIVATVVGVGSRDTALRRTPFDVGTQSSGSLSSNNGSNSTAVPSTVSPSTGMTPNTEGSGAIEWATPQVHLFVAGWSITTTSNTGTLVFTASVHKGEPDNTPPPTVSVYSDPGTATHQTLELRWTELGREQRWYIDFASDGQDWWATQMRTYDGQLPKSDWVVFNGERFRTPLGSAWSGFLDVTASDHGVTSELRMNIEHLQAFISHG